MSAGRRRWLSAAAVCIVLSFASAGVAGCAKEGSETTGSGTATAPRSQQSDKSTPPVRGADGKLPTLGDYITQNNISEAPVKQGDPESPVLSLPTLQGWKPAGAATPPYAFAALIDTKPETAADPPTIVLLFSKLGSNADPEKILTLAPNELRNLPGYAGQEPVRQKFAGFDSVLVGGTYSRDGVTRLVGQRTVVIPAKDGLYVLQINADARTEDFTAIAAATSAIERGATIKTRG